MQLLEFKMLSEAKLLDFNVQICSSMIQTHLLRMRGNSDSHGHRLSFTKIIISIIKNLSSKTAVFFMSISGSYTQIALITSVF